MNRSTRREQKSGAHRRALFLILFLLFALALVFSILQIVRIRQIYSAGDLDYAAVSARYAPLPAQDPPPAPAPADGTDGAPAAVYPFATRPDVDFEALLRQNPDTRAWLYCEGTAIHYPVVQSGDNAYYLTHLFSGKQNANGAIFLDSQARADFSDAITPIFGHNMNSGAMFGSLKKYKRQDYYEAHPCLVLFTPEATYRVDLIAGYVTDADDPCYSRGFASPDAFAQYLTDAAARSTFQSAVTATAQDRLVALSTCTYEFHDAAYVLLGKLTALP